MSIKNMAASVRQRLLNQARATGENFQLLLTRYATERFLYRLSRSEHRERFVLKGAMLFVLWEGHLHRMTRDLDLLGYGSPDTEDIENAIRTVCEEDVEDDGLILDATTVRGGLIREDQEYGGVRVKVEARLGSARVQVQIDVGFGDAITPGAEEAAFPTILDLPAPLLRTYPRETVIAEKLEAMVALGIANSRMKDFYDITYLSRHFSFDGAQLAEAIAATFERRQTALPTKTPVALTSRFAGDNRKATQWRAFLRRVGLTEEVSLEDALTEVAIFVTPPLQSLTSEDSFAGQWQPGGPWEQQAE